MIHDMKKSKKTQKKAWGGRFAKATDSLLEQFSESVSFDWNLYDVDIMGSLAHAEMLHKIGILNAMEKNQICKGLKSILKEIEKQGADWFDASLEDVHMNIETALMKKIGKASLKLHTGRSRNDQVALDLRMKLKQFSNQLLDLLKNLQSSIAGFAKDHIDVVIPEMTHMQHAQPVLLAHHMLAYVEMFARDMERIDDTYKRINVMPLGSGACVGSGLPLDRNFVKKQLGFAKLTQNSVDAVSDRDFIVEFLCNLSLIATHLSRLSEEWILWFSTEFNFIELSDVYCTGSSMMPQKKNADALELIRGNTASVIGDLTALLILIKGLPLTYNRDMQDDKRRLFETFTRVTQSIQIVTGLVATTSVNAKVCEAVAIDGFAYATDMSDYLVKKNLPFRESHHVVGAIVGHCCKNNCDVTDMTLKELKKFSTLFEKDIFIAISLENCLKSKDVLGGTAPKQVKKQLKKYL
jgi:argininosuccinate lyase